MAVASKTPVNMTALPAALTQRPQWVLWRYEQRGKNKPTKVPYQAKQPDKKAKSSDPNTWATFTEAANAYQQGHGDGLGFVFSGDDGFCGVDLDGCCDADGTLSPWAFDIIDSLDSYTERSPSGTGVHIIVRGTLPKGGSRRGAVEMYDNSRYFTMTGDVLRQAGIEDRQEALQHIHHQHINKPREPQPAKPAKGYHHDDRTLLDTISASRQGAKFQRLWQGDTSVHGDDHSACDLALCNILAFWTPDPTRIDSLFRQSGLMRDKWDTRHTTDGKTYGEMTIARALQDVTANSTNPVSDGDDLRQKGFTANGDFTAKNPQKKTQQKTPLVQRWGERPQPAPPEWLVENLLQDRADNILAGEPGVGKSWLMADLAVCVATGTRFLDRETQQGDVLIINFDDSESLPRQWAEWTARAKGYDLQDLPLHYYQPNPDEPYPQHGLLTEDVFADMLDAVRDIQPRLIIIDAFASAFPTSDGNKADQTLNAFEHMRRLRVAAGDACMVLLDHTPKRTLIDSNRRGVSGSQQKHARARTVHIVNKVEDKENQLEWQVFKANAAPYQDPFAVNRSANKDQGLASLSAHTIEPATTKTISAKQAALDFLRASSETISKKDLIVHVCEAAGCSEDLVRKTLEQDVSQHPAVQFVHMGGRGNPVGYLWQDPNQTTPTDTPEDTNQADDLRQTDDLRQSPLPQINPVSDSESVFPVKPATFSQNALTYPKYPEPRQHHKQPRKRHHSKVDPTHYQALRLALVTKQLVPFVHPVSGMMLSPESTHSAVTVALDALAHPKQLDSGTVKLLDAALAAMQTSQAGAAIQPSYSRDSARNP
jgi:hypothetical protein